MRYIMLGAISLSVAALGLLPLNQETAAQTRQGPEGTWTLVSIKTVLGDREVLPYGPDAKGALIMDGKRFSIIIVRPNRPKFKSGIRTTGTPEENSETVHGSIALFGTYTVDPNDKMRMTLNIEESTFPNWSGTTQPRTIKFAGDTMELANPAASGGAGVSYVVWKRAE